MPKMFKNKLEKSRPLKINKKWGKWTMRETWSVHKPNQSSNFETIFMLLYFLSMSSDSVC